MSQTLPALSGAASAINEFLVTSMSRTTFANFKEVADRPGPMVMRAWSQAGWFSRIFMKAAVSRLFSPDPLLTKYKLNVGSKELMRIA